MDQASYSGSLFNSGKQHKVTEQSDIYTGLNKEQLIRDLSETFVQTYGTACLNVKQLQKALNVGETKVYQLLSSGKLACSEIGSRKVVPVIALAAFLINNTG